MAVGAAVQGLRELLGPTGHRRHRGVAHRLADRLHRIAELLGEPVGRRVGYLTRLDSKQSAATRILVVTEAIFVSRILGDQELTGVSAVLVVELDQGADIEETYGHDVATDALRVVAEAILDVTNRRDAVGWFGGSMFALVVPDTDGRSLAMRIQTGVARRPVVLHTADGPLTIALSTTIGVAEAPKHGRTATAALGAAEAALDRARGKGRGGQYFADESS